MKNKKITFAIILVFVLVLVFVRLYPFKVAKPQNVPLADRLQCKDFDRVTNAILDSLTADYKTTVRDIPITKNRNFFWQRNKSEPAVGYPAQSSRMIYRYGQPPDQNAKYFPNLLLFLQNQNSLPILLLPKDIN